MTDQEVTIPKGTRYGIHALRSKEQEITNNNDKRPQTNEEKDRGLIKEFRLKKSPFLQEMHGSRANYAQEILGGRF